MRYFPAGLALVVGLACVSAWAAVDTSADSPKELALARARRAAREEKAGEFAKAYLDYSEAGALDPSNRKYKGRMELLQTRAAQQSKPKPGADAGAAEDAEPALQPEDVFDSLTEREMAQARELKGLPSLKATPGKQNFDLTGDARILFDKVAQSFGLETVYDSDFPTGGARITFRIADADYREALYDLENATGSFVVPLSGKILMVAKDTPSKRNDLEQTIEVSVPMPQVTTSQELTEIAQVVRQTTNVEKIGWDTADSMIVMRDRVSRVGPAVALLQQLLSYRAEVMIELEFIQVSSSDLKNYGFTITNSISAYYLGNVLNNMTSIPSGVTNLLTFGGGKTLFGIGVVEAQAMFNESISTSNSLYRTQLRSVSGQPATLHVGEKYPIETSGYAGTVPAGQQGQVYTPPPAFTFEDLGLEMKVTPFVHGLDEVTLAVETSFEVLTGQTANSIPIIGNRKLSAQVRLRNEEWAVIGGLMGASDSKSVSGFWGLAQLPLIGNLFRQTSTDKESSNVLIAIRPHLISLPPDQMVLHGLRVGTENHPFIPL